MIDDPPGYSDIRHVVRIESEASASDIQYLLDVAEAHTSILDVFRRPQQLRREVHLTTPTA